MELSKNKQIADENYFRKVKEQDAEIKKILRSTMQGIQTRLGVPQYSKVESLIIAIMENCFEKGKIVGRLEVMHMLSSSNEERD